MNRLCGLGLIVKQWAVVFMNDNSVLEDGGLLKAMVNCGTLCPKTLRI